MPSQHDYDVLLRPLRLYSRREVLIRPSPVPARPGVYAWYFREVPPGVPVHGCNTHDGRALIYVGISPSKPPSNGKSSSKQSLAARVRYHFAGNAEGSTLRLTLGCLLRWASRKDDGKKPYCVQDHGCSKSDTVRLH